MIVIANNPEIFEHLDRETQQMLIKVLCGYTKVCVGAILHSSESEGEKISEALKHHQ